MPLSLTAFQRPPQDNGRGAYTISTSGWKGGDHGLDAWIPEFQALGLKWLKVLDDKGDSLPLCQKLVASGIFPVVRILRRDPPPNDAREPNPGHLNAAEEQTIKRLIDVGVLYFETNNEPDLSAEWKNGAIPADIPEAAKLVALNWLFDARFILDAGGYPGLPAVSGGGNLDLMGALVTLGRQDILLEGCWIAIHNYGLNRPLEYPNDPANQSGEPLVYAQYDFGPLTTWAWWNPERVRADTIDEVNHLRASLKNAGANSLRDHAGFREHEYYDALARKYLGRSIPILSTEGGYLVGRRPDLRYPRVTPQVHAELTVAAFDYMQREAPDYYFANMPTLLFPSPGRQPDAWYGDFWQRAFVSGPRTNAPIPPFPIPGMKLEPNLPAVNAVKAMSNLPRAGLPPPRPRPVSVAAARPASVAPRQSDYVVQRGDTLSGIAKKFSTTVTVIARANNIVDPSQLLVGQRLLIPAPAATPPPPPPPKRTVQPAVQPTAQPTTQPATPAAPTVPPPPPKRGGASQIDPRLGALGVQILPAMVVSGVVFWKLVRAVYEDPTQSGGDHTLYCTVLDESGAPIADQRVLQNSADGLADATTDATGTTNLPLAASYSPDRNENGPYSAWVDGLPSDRVAGLGLPFKRPVNFRLTWQKTVK